MNYLECSCAVGENLVTIERFLTSWAAGLNLLKEEVAGQSPASEGRTTFDDYTGLLFWRENLQACFDLNEVSRNSPEWSIVAALDLLLEVLTEPDYLNVMPLLEPDLFENDVEARWKHRIPARGQLGFEATATMRLACIMSPDFDAHVKAVLGRPLSHGAQHRSEADQETDFKGFREAIARWEAQAGTSPEGADALLLLAAWSAGLRGIGLSVKRSAAQTEGGMDVQDYLAALSCRQQLAQLPVLQLSDGDDSAEKILQALDSLFLHLTVPDDEVVPSILLGAACDHSVIKPWWERRLPTGGPLSFDLVAASRRANGESSPLDGRV